MFNLNNNFKIRLCIIQQNLSKYNLKPIHLLNKLIKLFLISLNNRFYRVNHQNKMFKPHCIILSNHRYINKDIITRHIKTNILKSHLLRLIWDYETKTNTLLLINKISITIRNSNKWYNKYQWEIKINITNLCLPNK